MSLLHPRFQGLKEVADKVLQQPVSSGQCERVWSSLNWVQGRLRGKLQPEKVKKLLRVYFGLARSENESKSNYRKHEVMSFMGEDFDIPEEWLGYEDAEEEAQPEVMASPESGEVELTPSHAPDGQAESADAR